MKLRKINFKELKDYIALLLNIVLIGAVIFVITLIPLVFWSRVLAFVLGILIGLAILASIALLIYTIHYIGKWFHWAIMYTWFSDKTELNFPPKRGFKGIWNGLNKHWGLIIKVLIICATISWFIVLVYLFGNGAIPIIVIIGLFSLMGIVVYM